MPFLVSENKPDVDVLPMLQRILPLLIIGLCVTGSVYAQTDSDASNEGAFITYTVSGAVEAVEGESIPMQALRSVMREPTLRNLDVTEGGNVFSFPAEFVFSTLERFEQWLASESTSAMLAKLRDRSRGSIHVALEMKRSPFANPRTSK